eukprot:436521-Rhodomonas_salina.4
MSGTDVAYGATRATRRISRTSATYPGTVLRPSYAIYGTGIRCACDLFAHYLMSGTDLSVLDADLLWYPSVLSWRMVLPIVRYSASVWCYQAQAHVPCHVLWPSHGSSISLLTVSLLPTALSPSCPSPISLLT